MKIVSGLLATLLAAFLLTACGEKSTEDAAATATEAAQTATEAASDAADSAKEAAGAAADAVKDAAPEVASGAGGYEPSADERVQGITLSAEELEAQAKAIDAGSAPAAE
jgi:hypothetical protein